MKMSDSIILRIYGSQTGSKRSGPGGNLAFFFKSVVAHEHICRSHNKYTWRYYNYKPLLCLKINTLGLTVKPLDLTGKPLGLIV